MIHLTWVSAVNRGKREDYDTDDTGEALAQAARKWWGSTGTDYPQESLVVCLVIERDNNEMTHAAVLEAIRDIEEIEHARQVYSGGPIMRVREGALSAERTPTRPPAPAKAVRFSPEEPLDNWLLLLDAKRAAVKLLWDKRAMLPEHSEEIVDDVIEALREAKAIP